MSKYTREQIVDLLNEAGYNASLQKIVEGNDYVDPVFEKYSLNFLVGYTDKYGFNVSIRELKFYNINTIEKWEDRERFKEIGKDMKHVFTFSKKAFDQLVEIAYERYKFIVADVLRQMDSIKLLCGRVQKYVDLGKCSVESDGNLLYFKVKHGPFILQGYTCNGYALNVETKLYFEHVCLRINETVTVCHELFDQFAGYIEHWKE